MPIGLHGSKLVQTETDLIKYNPVFSLGSNVVRGPLQIALRGQSWKNLIANGNFVNTTGWPAVDAVNSAVGNVLINTADGGGSWPTTVYTTESVIDVAHVHHLRLHVRVTNADCTSIVEALDGTTGGTDKTVATITSPTINNWYPVDLIDTPPADGSGLLKLIVSHVYASAGAASGKIMQIDGNYGVSVYDLTAQGQEALTEAQATDLFHYTEGMVYAEPASVDVVTGDDTYIWTPPANTVLRSLPDGTYDEIGSDGTLVQRVECLTLADVDITAYVEPPTNIDYVVITMPTDYDGYGSGSSIAGRMYLDGTIGDLTYADATASIGHIATLTVSQIGFMVAKGTYADIAAARAALNGKSLCYLLATAVTTPSTPDITLDGAVAPYIIGDEQTSVEVNIAAGAANPISVSTFDSSVESSENHDLRRHIRPTLV